RPSFQPKPRSQPNKELDPAKLTLDDLLKDPALAQEIGSPLIGRQLRVFQELERETKRLTEQLRENLPKVSYGHATQLLRQLSVSNDPGGMLVKRCDRDFDNLPDAVQSAVLMLKDPCVRLDPAS